MLKIKQFFLLLLSAAAVCTLAGCTGDGDTSGSAESNGMISKETNDRSANTESSKDLADMFSDVFSDIESAGEDLMSDAQDVASDWMDDLSDVVSDLTDRDNNDGANDPA